MYACGIALSRSSIPYHESVYIVSAKRPHTLLSDVARMAGVSLATASRALSEPSLVRPLTQQRVQDAISKLGYLPHGAARALATRRSRTVAAVVPTLNNPIFSSSVQALQQRLTVDGFTLLLASHEYDLRAEVRVVSTLIERGVDGILLVGTDHDPALYRLLDHSGIPYELTWTLDTDGPHHCLGFSNRAAAAAVTLHLLTLGHRDIAMVSGYTRSNDRARDRVSGVRQTLEAHGLRLPPHRLVETEFSIRSGRDAMAVLMVPGPLPTAIVCGNDLLALGVLLEACSRRVPVPEALSVTGFDDIDLAGEWSPSLTTMRLPVAQIGLRAAERMLIRIGGEDVPRIEEVLVSLVERQSSGPVRSFRAPGNAKFDG